MNKIIITPDMLERLCRTTPPKIPKANRATTALSATRTGMQLLWTPTKAVMMARLGIPLDVVDLSKQSAINSLRVSFPIVKNWASRFSQLLINI